MKIFDSMKQTIGLRTCIDYRVLIMKQPKADKWCMPWNSISGNCGELWHNQTLGLTNPFKVRLCYQRDIDLACC